METSFASSLLVSPLAAAAFEVTEFLFILALLSFQLGGAETSEEEAMLSQ
jgi:hypothetical protein